MFKIEFLSGNNYLYLKNLNRALLPPGNRGNAFFIGRSLKIEIPRGKEMEWLMFDVADVLEVVWACAMEYSEGFSKLVPSIVTVIGFLLSVVFLSLLVKKLPLGIFFCTSTCG